MPAQTRQSDITSYRSQSGCVLCSQRARQLKLISITNGLYLNCIAETSFEEGKSLEGRQEAHVSYARKITYLLRMRVASLTNTLGNPSANFLHGGKSVSYNFESPSLPIFARSASARTSHIRV